MKYDILRWTPRILTILIISLMLLLSFDAFIGTAPIGEKILGFLIHNIPTLAFIIVLLISWKIPIIGGVFFVLAGVFYVFIMRNSDRTLADSILMSLPLALPALLTGILYTLDWKINMRG